ncbi:hypothetical protein Tco_0209062 [Tanacetum coccineum]
MEEPEKSTKRKDQIRHDEEVAQRLQAQMQDELKEEDRLVRQREEEANISSWDNMQAMIDVDYQMAQQIQAEEQEKLTMRAQEKRSKPPTKAQKRNTMSTYLKNMAGYKHNQLKNKSFDDIQKLFNKEIKRVNTFVDMDTELVEGSVVRIEESSKKAGEDLQQESTKKQKIDDDKETDELQSLMEVIPDEEEVAVDAIPLATKPPSIVDWKILKEGKITYFQIIRADESSKSFLSSSQNNSRINEVFGSIILDLNSFDEQPKFIIVDDHHVLNEHDDSESVEDIGIAEDQVSTIIEPVSNVESSPTIISPSTEVFINPHVPQDRWSKEKHIELVNIFGEPQAGVATRSRIRDSKAASAHECLYVNSLSEIEPKKLIEALEEKGWIIAMQEELNQFERNKVWNLVPIPHGKTIIETK